MPKAVRAVTLPDTSGVVRTVVDGQPVDVVINWHHIAWLAKRAIHRNKTGRASAGPITVRVVR